MKQNKYIPQGYKDSPLGIIPQEWEVKRLGDIVQIMSGESPSLFNLNHEGKYPYVKVEDMNNCRKYQLSSRNYSDDEKSIIPKGSIIFPKRGAAILNNKVRISAIDIQMDSNMMAIIPAAKKVYYEFLFLKIIHLQLYKIADTSTIPQINNKHLLPYKITLPPLPEQQKIAEILTCWDAAIEKQAQLIEKLEARKRGLTQQLLTGEKRLRGFEGEWKIRKIKEIAKEYSTKNKDNNNLTVLSCTKYDGLVASLDYFGRRVFSEDTSSYKIVPNGYFAYATNHIEEGSIGYQNLFDNALISPMYTVFKTNADINDSYMYSLLKTHKLLYYYNALMEGSIDRRGGLRWESFSSIKLHIPSLSEQAAIANVLSVADEEIKKEKVKLATLKSQKRGLMQVLLTGKKRVKI